ncbi:MAG TPA: phasin family protein [Casimicrobiaceae bacterium]|nr:phasin family protein [Casimicrobiaceae bacterium]
MLKRAKASARAGAGAQTEDVKEMRKAVLDSSRQIWLAGLGAFSRAQAEGTKLFETLVRHGESIEARTRRAATDKAFAARDAAQAKAKEMQKMAGGTWDKLEKVFEDRVARALSRLGVHTQKDVEKLAARVDALSEAVNELIKASGGVATRRRVKPAAAPSASTMAKKAVRKTAPRAGRKAAK